jgi:hypothetical protein
MPITYSLDAKGRNVIPKGALEIKDYPIDWTAPLALIADTLLSAPSAFRVTANPESGCSIVSQSIFGAVTTPWVAGGIAGQLAAITCSVDTVGGRTLEQVIYIKIGA